MKNARTLVSTLLTGVMLAGAAFAAHADLAYGFDASAEGFTLNDAAAGALSWEAAGHLRVQDVTDATNVQLVLPAAATSGGWSAYTGGTLSFDARLETPIASYWPEFGAITLVSQQGSVVLDVVPDNEPGVEWKTYSVQLDAATWGQSAASFANALAGLQRVELNLEAGNGAIETILIDNVRVTAVPEPSTWALTLIGLACMGAVVRRNRA
jgi:hypothetical protein